jgi:hypothetical protein
VELIPPPFIYRSHKVQLSFALARFGGYHGVAKITKEEVVHEIQTAESYADVDAALRRAEALAREWIDQRGPSPDGGDRKP